MSSFSEKRHELVAFVALPEKHEPGGAEAAELNEGKEHRGKQQHDIRQHEAGGDPVQDFCDVMHDCLRSFHVR